MTKEKIVKIVVVVCVVVFVFLILWFGFLYPNKLFRENEKTFDEAGKRYFEVNQRSLPKDEGRILSVTLETLAKQKYLNDLFIPYKKETCDVKKSTVRAKIVNGTYQYYTYLKCGNYESNIDHEGPVIALNGKQEMTLNRGENYQEAGVSSVKDQVDGVLDVKSVAIKGEVDTSKVGIYTISYTAKDSLNNKTTVERKIEVIENLADTVKQATKNTGGIYKGDISGNYILFNHMLFRIVRVNEDGSVVIVSDDPLANIDYGSSTGRFDDSSLDKWLNDYFYNLLEDENKTMLLDSKWCDDVITTDAKTRTTCERYTSKRKVGILSLQDYNNSLDASEKSYLSILALSWYNNFSEDKKVWAVAGGFPYEEGVLTFDQDQLMNVKPAVVLKKNIKIVDGSGSMADPYIINEKKEAKRNSKVNTRQIGEYVSYSGYIFRIAGIEKDGTTKLIMKDVLTEEEMAPRISYDNTGTTKLYNPKEKGNIGYQINNEMPKYISTNLLVKKEISVPHYDNKVTYLGKRTTKKYNVRLSAPSAFEIFSGKSNNSTTDSYWLLESTKNNDKKIYVYYSGSIPYANELDPYTKASVKLRVYLDQDTYIKGGQGTYTNPFTIAK